MKIIGLIVFLFCSSARAGWTPRMDSLARQTESEYHLPHGTCHAFALQESNCDSSATRVETGYFNIGSTYYKRVMQSADRFVQDHAGSDVITERAYQSISFGLFQIMGFNYRAMGYDNPKLPEIALEDQFKYFGLFASDLVKRYHTLARVASAYNTGSPNKTGRQYVKNVLKYQRRFSY